MSAKSSEIGCSFGSNFIEQVENNPPNLLTVLDTKENFRHGQDYLYQNQYKFSNNKILFSKLDKKLILGNFPNQLYKDSQFYITQKYQPLTMNNQEPQSCTKCGTLPEDILMLACSHDLCLNCAADRLSFQMKKNRNANVIVCQQCHEKTPLDAQSVDVLKSMMKPTPTTNTKQPVQATTDSKYERQSRNDFSDRNASKFNYNKSSSIGIDRGIDPRSTDRQTLSKGPSKISNADLFQGISNKKSCVQHVDQEILYFCFDCKCECICPECIIHGKHKDHDVKTVKKSQPIVRSEIEGFLDRYENNVEGLLIKKSEIDKQIRTLNQQNNTSKRQIQQAFEDLKAKINSQQKELLLRCDQSLQENVSQLQKSSSLITAKIEELKAFTSTVTQSLKKDEILFLNFYSRKWRELQQQSKEPVVQVPNTYLPSNQTYLSQILDVNDQVTRIGAVQRGGRVYNQA